MQDKATRVLELSASGRTTGSASRELTRDLVAALEERHGSMQTIRRDLSTGVPFVDETWIEANFTPEASRTDRHRQALAFSDSLVAELKEADLLVIGMPIYNFSIPAALKAWIDMITRARLTFRYTESGPRGLLEGKRAYVVVASGGVPVGSAADFATPYMKHALAFIGITDIEVIAADQLNSRAEMSMDAARARIADIAHLKSQAA
ncbi:MAG: NAD(P)H-dependent oxidoreductase [Gammaproteobacteria bacterium]|nr:NAD(P)H-dependent oxidoreductase [Gammaproteobacteria bacterium]MDH3363290.1 NAD(P)H-dependent oxidoreductase [Gammaproteobacteria bacterium]MDH3480095.1 NAD(P)H-dependent oxidoreductase [Gammaproteobacteria bacterium]